MHRAFFAVAHNYFGLFKENVETLVAGGPVYRQQFEKELLSLPNDVLLCGESKFKISGNISKMHVVYFTRQSVIQLLYNKVVLQLPFLQLLCFIIDKVNCS